MRFIFFLSIFCFIAVPSQAKDTQGQVCVYQGVMFSKLSLRQFNVLRKNGAKCRGEGTAIRSNNQTNSSKFKPRIQYTNYTDGSCKNSKKRVCINKKDYKYLCNKAKGATINLRRMAAVMYRHPYSTFIRSDGNFGSLRINFQKPNNCAVSFIIPGMYKGSTKRQRISGRAATFVVTKSGEVLVHYISTS